MVAFTFSSTGPANARSLISERNADKTMGCCAFALSISLALFRAGCPSYVGLLKEK